VWTVGGTLADLRAALFFGRKIHQHSTDIFALFSILKRNQTTARRTRGGLSYPVCKWLVIKESPLSTNLWRG
jgi:hypothetical protein